jgi:glycosyltransferase involved in cell wall biosynthesis
MGGLRFSVCIPTYNRGAFIGTTIRSLLAQTYTDYEIIISDNNSTDNTREIVNAFSDKRIKYFYNATNLGFAGNMELCRERSSGDIFYILAAKSVIAKDALMRMRNAFELSDDIGAVVVPYYWYGAEVTTPVRAKPLYDSGRDTVFSVKSDERAAIAAFRIVDNPSAMALRRAWMDVPFHKEPFVEFVYPFASVAKRHKVVILKDYAMACPAFVPSGSQSPSVYKVSPIQNWFNLFSSVFFEEEFKGFRKICIKDFVAVNYIGLAQVKNYGGFKALLREIFYLLKYRWENIFSPAFWTFSAGTVLIPRFMLKRMVVFYKASINRRLLKNIKPLDI